MFDLAWRRSNPVSSTDLLVVWFKIATDGLWTPGPLGPIVRLLLDEPVRGVGGLASSHPVLGVLSLLGTVWLGAATGAAVWRFSRADRVP